jgi:hypothetical protein
MARKTRRPAAKNPLENLGGTIASIHLRQNVDKAGALEAAFKNGDRLALSQAVDATQQVVQEATSIENRFNQAIQGIIADLGYLPELRVSTLLTEGVSEPVLESPSQHFLVESATPQLGVGLNFEAEIIPQTAFDLSAEEQSIAATEPFVLVDSSRISLAETITTIELPALTDLPDFEPAAPTENIDIPSVSPVSEVFVDSPKVAKTEVTEGMSIFSVGAAGSKSGKSVSAGNSIVVIVSAGDILEESTKTNGSVAAMDCSSADKSNAVWGIISASKFNPTPSCGVADSTKKCCDGDSRTGSETPSVKSVLTLNSGR